MVIEKRNDDLNKVNDSNRPSKLYYDYFKIESMLLNGYTLSGMNGDSMPENVYSLIR